MAAVNSIIASFVPGLIVHFGSFNFTAGDDGKLGASHLEAHTSGQIGSDLANNLLVGHGDASATIPQDNAPCSGHGPLSSPGLATIRSGEGNNASPELLLRSGDPST